MIKAIESNLYKISKNENYDDEAYSVTVIDTCQTIIVFKEELEELIELLKKAKDML